MFSIIIKIFPIVGMDNETDYSECRRNAPKFTYIHKVFFGFSKIVLCIFQFQNKSLMKAPFRVETFDYVKL